MALSDEAVATLLWIGCLVIGLAVFNLVFYLWSRFSNNDVLPSFTEPHKVVNNERGGYAVAGTDTEFVEVNHNAVTELSIDPVDNKLSPRQIKSSDKTVSEIDVEPKLRSRFAMDKSSEYIFNDRVHKKLHSVCLDDDVIKVSSIWSRYGHQEKIAYFDKNCEKFTEFFDDAPAKFTIKTKTVPLAFFSHIECTAYATKRYYIQYFILWIELFLGMKFGDIRKSIVKFGSRVKSFFCTLCESLVYLLVLAFLVALVFCFYVPAFMQHSPSDVDNSDASKRLTLGILVATVIASGLHIIYLGGTYKKSTAGTVRMWRLSSFALVFLLVCLGLSATMYDISLGNVYLGRGEEGGSSGSGGSGSSGSNSGGGVSEAAKQAFLRFSCGCVEIDMPSYSPTRAPSMPTYRPTAIPSYSYSPSEAPLMGPTESPTYSLSPTMTPTLSQAPTTYSRYEFECAADMSNAQRACEMNCGVCAPTYRDPFLSFTAFGAFYMFVMLFVAHYQWYFTPRVVTAAAEGVLVSKASFLSSALVVEKRSASYLMVTIHGSRSFGYPLRFRMSVTAYQELEARLNALVSSEHIKRSGDVMRHFALTGSANSLIPTWYGK